MSTDLCTRLNRVVRKMFFLPVRRDHENDLLEEGNISAPNY